MPQDLESAVTISEQAAHWWVIFHDGDAPSAQHREFGEWVARSPERVEAYLRMARLHQVLTSNDIRWPATDAATLIRAAKAADTNVQEFIPLRRSLPHDREPRPWQRVPLRLAFAVAAVVLIGIFSVWLAAARPQQFQTRFGEQRSIMLTDGSRITLNTASRVEVDMRHSRRLIRLLQGEVLFEVAHDPDRPFDVHAGAAVLRAVGTQFDVDSRPGSTTVTVVEGRVSVFTGNAQRDAALAPLRAADRLVIRQSGIEPAQHGVNVAAALSWTQHQLMFEQRPLGEVAEEFNRYNRQRIRIDSDELRAQKVTGVFQSNDPASFVAFLSGIPGVRISADGNGGQVVSLQSSAAPVK